MTDRFGGKSTSKLREDLKPVTLGSRFSLLFVPSTNLGWGYLVLATLCSSCLNRGRTGESHWQGWVPTGKLIMRHGGKMQVNHEQQPGLSMKSSRKRLHGSLGLFQTLVSSLEKWIGLISDLCSEVTMVYDSPSHKLIADENMQRDSSQKVCALSSLWPD